MKCTLLFLLFTYFLIGAVFALTTETTHPRGCVYALGKCIRECEEGTHSYTTGCGVLRPERTCEDPEPRADPGAFICDYSRCDCDEPTVRDKVTGRCVLLENCPDKNEN